MDTKVFIFNEKNGFRFSLHAIEIRNNQKENWHNEQKRYMNEKRLVKRSTIDLI